MGLFEAMMIIVWILFSLGFAWSCASMAKSRGRDPIVWGILGFFLNLWALATLLILIFFKRISEQRKGIHRIMYYLGVILLSVIAVTAQVMLARSMMPESEKLYHPTLEWDLDQQWRGDATAEQLNLIGELSGTEIKVGKLIERISPQTLQELPDNLVEALYEEPVRWLDNDLNDSLVNGAFDAVLDRQKETQKLGMLFYYIGNSSKEILPLHPALVGEYPYNTTIAIYRLSVYTGE